MIVVATTILTLPIHKDDDDEDDDDEEEEDDDDDGDDDDQDEEDDDDDHDHDDFHFSMTLKLCPFHDSPFQNLVLSFRVWPACGRRPGCTTSPIKPGTQWPFRTNCEQNGADTRFDNN